MRIFLRPSYLLFAAAVTTTMLALLSWTPLMGSIVSYLSDPLLPLSHGVRLILQLLGSSIVESIVSSPLKLALSIAMGINVPLLVYFARAYRPGIPIRGLPPSIAGFIASIVGIGCAACGAVFFGAFSASATGLLLALPFNGVWLGYLGVFLLIVSSWYLARTIYRAS